ncbi:hypothetical protein LIER_42124 [Lithospermum erythrorhizon]|uniref:Retrotransposon gag domain-containing protein n=1 Tax=Lithospermum erythrorhizon TaxID=34254 RepID=A0AAV3RNC8_LITER
MTKMPFTDRRFQTASRGKPWTGNGGRLQRQVGMAIQTMQDERILMDIMQNADESLSSYHKRYNDLLLSIPTVDDKVAYMAFVNWLAYGKIKRLCW